MSIQSRIEVQEGLAAGALVPWLGRTKALAGRGGDVEQAALDLGAPPELAAKIKAAIGAESTTSQPGLAGSSTAVTAFISQASETSILLRILADRAPTIAPMRTRLIATAQDVTAAIAGEGQPIPMQRLPLANPITLEPARIAAATVLTKELLRDVSTEGAQFVSSLLRGAIAQAADAFLFSRLTDSGTLHLSSDGSDADLLAQLRAALMAVGRRAGTGFISPPRHLRQTGWRRRRPMRCARRAAPCWTCRLSRPTPCHRAGLQSLPRGLSRRISSGWKSTRANKAQLKCPTRRDRTALRPRPPKW